jgi:Protein of unknown function (DUF3168)
MTAVDQTTLLEYQLRQFLLGLTDLAALVADRVFPAPAPQNAIMPLVTLQRISTAREYALQGRVGLAGAVIQIDCWADAPEYAGSYALAKQIAETVRLSLESFQGFMGPVRIQEVTLDTENDIFEPMDRTRRVMADYRIWYDESSN